MKKPIKISGAHAELKQGMKIKTMAGIFIIFLFLFILQSAQAKTWQETLEENFDIVDTFDDLLDWTGTMTQDVTNSADMPKHLDGSLSIWGYYSFWNTEATTSRWIANFGNDTHLGGSGKSLIIDLGNKAGPSRLGVYFGNGTRQSGYEDIYLFYFVKIPKNEWPTYIDADSLVGTYTENYPYVYFDSWKFGTINMGNTGPFNFNGIAKPYSDFHIIPHLKKSNYINNGKISLKLEPNDNGTRYGYWSSQSIQDFLPGWWAIELHFKNVVENDTTCVYMDAWKYDSSGNGQQILDNVRQQYNSQPSTDRWNYWFFGGNNSNTYSWGSTMESLYYVDDFIIDKHRIGPKYFELLMHQQNGEITGDLNSDGKVDITDVQACVNHFLGAQDWGTKADVNQDGKVDVIDVQRIVNTVLAG